MKNDEYTAQAWLFVKVKATVDHNTGSIVTLSIPAHALTAVETETLDTLFPDFGEEVIKLLAKQALMNAICK